MSACLTTRELAERLGLAKITLEIWRSRGEGPPYVKVGRAVRYRVEAVEAWLEARTVTTSAEAR